MSRDDPDGEFTRFKAKVKLGDGPDQRGEVTVETVRHVRPDRSTASVVIDSDAGTAAVDDVPVNHRVFGEFAFELGRATDALRNSLGLDEADDGGDA